MKHPDEVEDHEIAAALGVDPGTMGRWIVFGDDFDPPFPEPVRFEERAGGAHLYSLAEVKAWYERAKPEA